MRRILPRTALSEDPREFVLAAVLFTLTAVLFAGFGVTTLSGAAFDPAELRDATLAYRVLGWAKYLAFARLLWIAHRSAVHHGLRGARRFALLWSPMLLLALYGWLQWRVMGVARADFLRRTGHPDDAVGAPAFFIAASMAAAFAATALNALWVERRQIRIAR